MAINMASKQTIWSASSRLLEKYRSGSRWDLGLQLVLQWRKPVASPVYGHEGWKKLAKTVIRRGKESEIQ